MKKDFFDIMFDLIEKDDRVFLLFVGLGFPRYDEFKEKYPNRVINTEASEQTALDIAVGLGLSGKIPFVYTITPFFWRAAETIRNYVSNEGIQVIMCGAGRNRDYTPDNGFSHDGTDIRDFMASMRINSFWPENKEELETDIKNILQDKFPAFLSLRR